MLAGQIRRKSGKHWSYDYEKGKGVFSIGEIINICIMEFKKKQKRTCIEGLGGEGKSKGGWLLTFRRAS